MSLALGSIEDYNSLPTAVAFAGPSSPPTSYLSPGISESGHGVREEEGEDYKSSEQEKFRLRDESSAVLLADEVDEDVSSFDIEEVREDITPDEIDGMEIGPEDRSTPATRPRDIFSPQHRIPRAPTPPTNRLADLLHLLTDEERELILSFDQETRSNISREEGDSPSIDSVMEDQLPSRDSTTPVITQPRSSLIRISESLSSGDNSLESLGMGTAAELDGGPEDWNTAPSITSFDNFQASMEEVDPATADENQDSPRPPFELLRLPIFPPFLTSTGFPRPGNIHFMTADDFEEGLNESYDEPIIDIETDNLDFSRLCRRLYDYYPFDPTTFRPAPLAAQIKGLKRPEDVTREDMEANGGDCQGIPWENLGMTRDEFRVLRNRTYKNYRNIPHVTYTKVSVEEIYAIYCPCKKPSWSSMMSDNSSSPILSRLIAIFSASIGKRIQKRLVLCIFNSVIYYL